MRVGELYNILDKAWNLINQPVRLWRKDEIDYATEQMAIIKNEPTFEKTVSMFVQKLKTKFSYSDAFAVFTPAS